MLEERLSKAYSQQGLGGYNLPPPRQPAGPYPSIPSHAPTNLAGAESFYTGQQPSYAPPGQPYQQLPPATPQAQFATYRPTPEPTPAQYPPQQQAQRSDSWQARAPSAPSDPYQQPQAPREPSHGMPTPQQTAATPSTDPNASYYFNPQQAQPSQPPSGPSAPGPAPDSNSSPYPNLQQSMQYPRGSVSAPSQATPVQTPAQPAQPPQQPPQQPQAPAPSEQQHYWQPAVPQQPQSPPQAAPQQWNYGYGQQTSFPTAPQHEPVKQPAQEEALIEL